MVRLNTFLSCNERRMQFPARIDVAGNIGSKNLVWYPPPATPRQVNPIKNDRGLRE